MIELFYSVNAIVSIPSAVCVFIASHFYLQLGDCLMNGRCTNVGGSEAIHTHTKIAFLEAEGVLGGCSKSPY